jgi:hypothetical protein
LQLVVYASASGFLLTAAAAALLSSLRSNASMEAYQRAEERWSRLSHLIQSEASEASEVLYGQSLHCAGSSGNADVTLRIPYVSESGGVQSEAMALVQYYKVGSGAATELRRCGAPYLADGRLNFASPSRVPASPCTPICWWRTPQSTPSPSRSRSIPPATGRCCAAPAQPAWGSNRWILADP